MKEAENPGKEHTPYVEGELKRETIDRTNNFGQAGETYRRFSDFERDELIKNLVNTLAPCDKRIQEQMIENFTKADPEYGQRVKDGLAAKAKEMESGAPMGATQAEEAVQQAQDVSHPSDPY